MTHVLLFYIRDISIEIQAIVHYTLTIRKVRDIYEPYNRKKGKRTETKIELNLKRIRAKNGTLKWLSITI